MKRRIEGLTSKEIAEARAGYRRAAAWRLYEVLADARDALDQPDANVDPASTLGALVTACDIAAGLWMATVENDGGGPPAPVDG